MKKKLFKILSVIMTLLLFIGVGVGVNAYSFDSNGNIVSNNLADSSCFKENTAISANGSYYSLSGYNCYYKVPLTPGTTYTISFNNSEITTRDLAFYDVNGIFISINNGFDIVGFTLPSNVYYISFDFRNDLTNVMINTGNSALTYEPYGTWYSESNSQIKQAIGTLANTNNIVVDLLESGEIYNSETYSNFFDLPFTTSYGQLTIPVNVFENWNESQHPNAVGNITFNYSNGIVPTNTYGTIYIITWQYYTIFNITYYDGTSQHYQSTGDSTQVTNPSNTFIKSITFETEYLSNYGPNITFALDNNYSSGYSNGYEKGYNTGYENGYTTGSTGKYQEGYNNGYNEGYEQGYEDNPEDKTLYNMVLAIADVPITLFTQIFNFDILGVNIAGFVTSLVSIAIIVWLVKFFI